LDEYALVDNSSITGESSLVRTEKGGTIFSLSVVKSPVVHILIEKKPDQFFVSVLKEKVRTLSESQTRKEKLLSRYAAVMVPIALLAFALISFALPVFTSRAQNISYLEAMNANLKIAGILLIVSCPCAILINVPLIYIFSVSKLSKKGYIIKQVGDFEALRKINFVIFDKTGTLTNESAIREFSNQTGYDDAFVKNGIKSIESFSNHPKGKQLVDALADSKIDLAATRPLFNDKHGIAAVYRDAEFQIGSADFVTGGQNDDKIYVKVDGRLCWLRLVNDNYEETRSIVNYLRNQNIGCCILSGDAEDNVAGFARKCGISEYYYEKDPLEKQLITERLSKKYRTLYVGDGINDLLALNTSYLSVAFGASSQYLAKQNSAFVVLNNRITSLIRLLKASRFVSRFGNLILFLILGIKILIFSIALLPWFADLPLMVINLFSDIGLSFIMMSAVILTISASKIFKAAAVPESR
jgi:Cd2+/Zn2+-exporting ATPase